ncbi:hypothetical protein HAX54_050797, partial [Datura stramonium]|nr:hypothetical protein [Datura stramonium]
VNEEWVHEFYEKLRIVRFSTPVMKMRGRLVDFGVELKWDNLLSSRTGSAHHACHRGAFVLHRAMLHVAKPVRRATGRTTSPAPRALHCAGVHTRRTASRA